MAYYTYWNPQGTQSVPWNGRNQAFQVGLSASQYNGNNNRHFDRDTGYTKPASHFNSKTWSSLYGAGYIDRYSTGNNPTFILVTQGFIGGRVILYGTNTNRTWVRIKDSWYGEGGGGGNGGNGQNSWITGQAGQSGLAALTVQQFTPEVFISTQGGYTFQGGGGGGGGGTGWNHRNSQNQNATQTCAGGGGGGGSGGGQGGAGGNSERGTAQSGQDGYYGGGGGGPRIDTGSTPGGNGGSAGQYGQQAPTQSADGRYGGNINPNPGAVGGANGPTVQASYSSGGIY